MTIRGVIFDLGWTLVDFAGHISATEPQRARAVRDFLEVNGFDGGDAPVFASYREEMRALWEVGRDLNYEYPARLAMLRALRRHMKHQDAARLAAAALAASFDPIVPMWQPYADTFSTLAALRDAGYCLGCISNTNDGTHVWRIVDRHGLRSWLSPIFMSDEFGLRKPHTRIFHTVLEMWEMPPDEVVMVGDTLNADVLGAHNTGMRGIWIDRGLVNPWSDNENSQSYILPDATIKQLGELPELLAGW